MTQPDDEALSALIDWYDGYRPSPRQESERYVVCAGLAVLERLRDAFPLEPQDYITEKNQVRTGGPFIQGILARYGETRVYTREGGRTTRGTRPAAEALVQRLNALDELADLDQEERAELADRLQGWLVERVRDYFNRQRIAVEIDLGRPGSQIVEAVLAVAAATGKAGAVAQHLVGAKLALRYEEAQIENHSYTTADRQLGRPGDFVVGDTAFHVTVAPMEGLIRKCEENLRAGYRPLLLVPEGRVAAARQLAEIRELHERIGILPIENFVGQNIEEMGGFGRSAMATGFRALLEAYNERVAAVETDRSLMIEIPENLR